MAEKERAPESDSKSGKKELSRGVRIGLLVGALVLVIAESVLFAGMLAGWFDGDSKVTISSEYMCSAAEAEEFINLTASDYEELVADGKSFVIFVDQGGCTTADGLRGRIIEYAKKKGIKINRIMFSEMKETSLYDKVKFYPSVAVVSDGEVVAYLRADSDADAAVYNDYEALEGWLMRYLK
ncbi:hypothetical protein IJG90_03710 [Candidatus Saccharibacteria bacterium]|nr:hypothetical protein [Candidatus Saccharibacteria bacterium]